MEATNTRIEVKISQAELREFVKEKTGVDVSGMTIDDFSWAPTGHWGDESDIIFDFTK